MASIQQSFNQMLGSAQFAAGLYAHTPMGKEQAEIQTARRTAQTAGKRTTEAVIAAVKEAGKDDDTITKEKIYTGDFGETLEEAGGREVKAKKKLFEVSPSDKNYEAYLQAKQSLDRFQDAKMRYQNEKNLTRQLLEGDPNPLNIKKTKVEVDINGK